MISSADSVGGAGGAGMTMDSSNDFEVTPTDFLLAEARASSARGRTTCPVASAHAERANAAINRDQNRGRMALNSVRKLVSQRLAPQERTFPNSPNSALPALPLRFPLVPLAGERWVFSCHNRAPLNAVL